MQINKTGINFKANFFTIEKKGCNYNLSKISTDNKENLGKEPVLQTQYAEHDFELPMVYDGKYYTTNVVPFINKYRIYYQDTGKYENNGEKQIINSHKYTKIAAKEDRLYNNLPPEYAIAKGQSEGLVVVNTFNIPTDVPVILVFDELNHEETLVTAIPHNVRGVIISSSDMGLLSHAANLTRNRISVMSVIWDEDKYNKLKNKEGKYISIDNEDGIVEFSEIKPSTLKTEIVEKTEVPKLENIDRLLNFDELTPQNSGNKGYRIGLMQKLVKEGKLKDITIPNGFVIPEGYIKKYREYINVEDSEEHKKRILNSTYTQDVENRVAELGLQRRHLMIRSNFNTEDLRSFSSAGAYDSMPNYDSDIILNASEITESSQNSDLAKRVHKRHGIKNEDVQPSVIVQDRIIPDYKFTVYSDDGDNNIIIELTDEKIEYLKPMQSLIKYNKRTKTLNIERTQSPFAEYLLDEQGRILEQSHKKDSISENWKILAPLMSIITTASLTLEKFFKYPQDIEGGIKDGKVYLWQTRDIVAKTVKKI